MKKIAVLTTSFNRKEKTLRAFTSLNSNSWNDYELEFYLCDDASTDGTAEAVKALDMNVSILKGTGDLFWSRGMHVAMQAAREKDYDFYLMINDDVDFYNDAITTMLESYNNAKGSCGIVGPTCSEDKNITTYSGKNLNESKFIEPNGNIQKCDLANWNCFMVDRKVIEAVGIIDNYYEHAHGDYDYSLMMKRAGFSIFVAMDYIGICTRNSPIGTFRDKKLSRKKRIKHLHSKQGIPLKSGFYYCKKNYNILGIRGFKSFFVTYIKSIFSILIKRDC